MRLFILAIVAGIGVLVGVALYVGQDIVNPGSRDIKVTAKLDDDDAKDKSESTDVDLTDATDSLNRRDSDGYKSQLREASYPAGTTSFDTVSLRKQLPDIFQFPDQPTAAAPEIAALPESANNSIAANNNNASQKNSAFPPPPADGIDGAASMVPDAPGSGSGSDLRPDTPMLKNLTAPEHRPSVSTATNPNVQVEVAPASDGRAARTKMIVSR
ncbi:MAG: hypothetical protein SGJ27_15485 [Candidatus Melainabacteria bacterium]|nr:hypothetical protein [Candidatus Melainabacteria bacterium]